MTVHLSTRARNNDVLNRFFLVLLYGVLGFGGSLFSVVVIGGLAFTSAKYLMGRLTARKSYIAWSVMIAGAAYYTSGVLMVVADPQADNLSLLWERLPFLLCLPLILQLRWSSGSAIQKALETGALIGAFGLAAWIVVEVIVFPLDLAEFRAKGPPGNSGPLATCAAFLFAVNLLAVSNGSRQRRFVAGFAAFICAAIVGLSGMRTLLPVLVIVPFIFFLLIPSIRRAALQPAGLAAIGAAIGLFLIVAGAPLEARLGLLWSYVGDVGLQPSAGDSLGQRIALWICAVDAFGGSPFLGLGRAGALDFMQSCTLELTGTAISYSHFHNAVFNSLAIGGLVELVATLSLLVVPLYWAWRFRATPDARYGVALVAALSVIFLLNGAFNIMLDHDIHDALFIHGMSTGLAIISRSRAEPAQTKPD
jgi:O-antigen ligase